MLKLKRKSENASYLIVFCTYAHCEFIAWVTFWNPGHLEMIKIWSAVKAFVWTQTGARQMICVVLGVFYTCVPLNPIDFFYQLWDKNSQLWEIIIYCCIITYRYTTTIIYLFIYLFLSVFLSFFLSVCLFNLFYFILSGTLTFLFLLLLFYFVLLHMIFVFEAHTIFGAWIAFLHLFK